MWGGGRVGGVGGKKGGQVKRMVRGGSRGGWRGSEGGEVRRMARKRGGRAMGGPKGGQLEVGESGGRGGGVGAAHLDNSSGLVTNGIKQGGGMMRELAKGPGHVGQVLLTELLHAALCLPGKPQHQPFTVEACTQNHHMMSCRVHAHASGLPVFVTRAVDTVRQHFADD